MTKVEFNGETHFVTDIWEFIELLPSETQEAVSDLVHEALDDYEVVVMESLHNL
ncbi:hypothetical protein P4H82_27665 [Bacillus cereus]|nr:hypothetical protein [Bacillus cereus]MEB9190703.1 hypothetical protein [Bacillus cereus]